MKYGLRRKFKKRCSQTTKGEEAFEMEQKEIDQNGINCFCFLLQR